ncbi:MAG: hypothetical protein DSY55_03795 [Clostridia bacterium]|nr:MAG: hypothetical protein DSY55_03795 [Clostridia bacterium]
MKRLPSLIVGLVLLLAACAGRQQPSPPPRSPIATTVHETPAPTRTPNPLTPASDDRVGPTVTPLPIKQVIDIDPDIPNREKITIIIQRENGDFIQIWASSERFQDDQVISRLGQLLPELGLTSSDKVFDIAPPASLMGKEPPGLPEKQE